MSHLVKTRAIVLRHAPYSETSRVVQWLTEDHGKLATIAKGALRPRNAFLGQFDLFYTCELLYYARHQDTVYVTREVAPLATRNRFRTDWRASLAAGYLTDLASRVAQRHDPSPELFELLDSALTDLDRSGWHPPMCFCFELKLLEQLGFAPRLDRCVGCDTESPAGSSLAFSSRRGGILCRTCAEGEPDLIRAGPDIIAILSLWQRASGWTAARAARCQPRQLQSIRALLGDFLTFHLELPLDRRHAALALLD